MDAIISLRAGVLRGTVVALQISAQLLPTTDCALPLSKIRAKYQEAAWCRSAELPKLVAKRVKKDVDVERSIEFSKWLQFFFLLVKVVSQEKSSNKL